MTDQEKATEIRDRLRNHLGKIIDASHHVDIVVRYSGRDIRFEFDWVKELLK